VLLVKVPQDNKATRVQRVRWGLLVIVVGLDLLVKVPQDNKVPQVNKVPQDNKVQRVRLVIQDNKVILVQLVNRAILVLRETLE
jgi:hypothetical protein